MTRCVRPAQLEEPTDPRPADEAKRGLLASVTGKAKEVAGAVLGNDFLATEGQLQQGEAAARRDAGLKDAVAQAEASEAAEVLARENAAARLQEQAAEAAAAARADEVEREAALQAVQAAAQVERQEVVETATAEAEARVERQQAVAQAQAEQVCCGEAGRDASRRRRRTAAGGRARCRADDTRRSCDVWNCR